MKFFGKVIARDLGNCPLGVLRRQRTVPAVTNSLLLLELSIWNNGAHLSNFIHPHRDRKASGMGMSPALICIRGL